MPILNVSCCGCSLKTGTIFIAIYYLVSSLEATTVVVIMTQWKKNPQQSPENITTPQQFSENSTIPKELVAFVSDHHTELCLSATLNAFQAIMAICLFFGVIMEEAILLLVWVIVECMLIIAINVLEILIIIGLSMTLNEMLSHVVETYVVIFSILTPVPINLALTVYMVLVVYSCYQELYEKTRSNRGSVSTAEQATQV